MALSRPPARPTSPRGSLAFSRARSKWASTRWRPAVDRGPRPRPPKHLRRARRRAPCHRRALDGRPSRPRILPAKPGRRCGFGPDVRNVRTHHYDLSRLRPARPSPAWSHPRNADVPRRGPRGLGTRPRSDGLSCRMCRVESSMANAFKRKTSNATGSMPA